MGKTKKNIKKGIRIVSEDFPMDTNSPNELRYYLYVRGKPVASYQTYEQASAMEGRLLISELGLKPYSGGQYKAYNAFLKNKGNNVGATINA